MSNNDETLFLNEEEGQLAVDVLETQDKIIIRTAIAGVKSKDLDINVTNDLVTIRGTREETKDYKNSTLHYQECFWGTFSRSIVLPHHVKPDEATAKMKDGVLTLTIPKTSGEIKLEIKEEL